MNLLSISCNKVTLVYRWWSKLGIRYCPSSPFLQNRSFCMFIKQFRCRKIYIYIYNVCIHIYKTPKDIRYFCPRISFENTGIAFIMMGLPCIGFTFPTMIICAVAFQVLWLGVLVAFDTAYWPLVPLCWSTLWQIYSNQLVYKSDIRIFFPHYVYIDISYTHDSVSARLHVLMSPPYKKQYIYTAVPGMKAKSESFRPRIGSLLCVIP